MAEATLVKDAPTLDVTTPAAGYASCEVVQMVDGRAGVKLGLRAATSGDPAEFATTGQWELPKTASLNILKGGKVYWDRSANTATPLQAMAGADFYVGVATEDSLAAATTVKVDLNVKPRYAIDLHEDAFDTVLVGTSYLNQRGGQTYMSFTTAAEAEKIDLLSRKSVPVTIGWIMEGKFSIATVADADVGDFNIGVANATHASDCDSITESAFFHQDSGADLNLDAESDDGTTEVAATDTTVDIVADTEVEVWIDGRDLSDIQYYVNGVNVLASTVFKLNAATGPLKLLAHWEKSSNDTAGEARVSHLALRTFD